MDKKKKVLVIGAKGMLGQELVSIFKADSDYVVTAWDFDKIDITDEASAKEKINKLAPEIILNAAAYNAVDACEKDKAEYARRRKFGRFQQNLYLLFREMVGYQHPFIQRGLQING